jgi:hypothetical protein
MGLSRAEFFKRRILSILLRIVKMAQLASFWLLEEVYSREMLLPTKWQMPCHAGPAHMRNTRSFSGD